MIKEFVPETRSDKKDAEISRLREALKDVCHLAQHCIENITDAEQAVIDKALAALGEGK